MLIEQSGDLFASPCNVLAHQCNCFSTMGAGIAKEIKKRYPIAYEADCNDPREPQDRLGGFSIGFDHKSGRLVGNLYGQYQYHTVGGSRMNTDYGALASAWTAFLSHLKDVAYPFQAPIRIGVPYKIGCGLAGGDWTVVRKILEDGAEVHGVDVYVYKL